MEDQYIIALSINTFDNSLKAELANGFYQFQSAGKKIQGTITMILHFAFHLVSLITIIVAPAFASQQQKSTDTIETSGFKDGAHHWYDIKDEVHKIIIPNSYQKQYETTQINEIAENILLYQKSNGGWEKNYDMLAILTDNQKNILRSFRNDISMTTFDNGATHSHIEYLAEAYLRTKNERYKDACLRGIDFIISAQYPNGGFPQFYPDTSGYRKYITFNDGAMGGIFKILRNIVQKKPQYDFIDGIRREKVKIAFERCLDCIVQSQIRVNAIRTAWCQQHDNNTLRAQDARTFEPTALCSQESAELVLLLMTIKKPTPAMVETINGAVAWFLRSRIFGIKVVTIKAAKTEYQYHATDEDKIVVQDIQASPIWSRLYEIETNIPLFCNRDGRRVYSLAEVDRERRTGYGWYNYEPDKVIKKYPQWQKKWSPNKNIVEEYLNIIE